MDFNLTEEQQMLQDTVARLARDHYGFEAHEAAYRSEQGFSTSFWARLCELGLTAVPFAEAHGGLGGSGVDTMLVMQEFGRNLCLEPFLPSQVFAGGLLQQLGNASQHERYLAPVVSGELQLAVALEESQSHYQLQDVATQAQREGDGWVLSGQKCVVIGGPSAGLIIVSARTSGDTRDEQGISLFLIDPKANGVTLKDYPCIDGRKACDLLLDKVPAELLGEQGMALPALRYQQGRAIAAQCAEAIGSMEEVFRLTLDYLKTRQQFGVPIGKFQVLQHRMADMRSELELASSMAILLACVADHADGVERDRRIHAGKYIVARAARFIAEQGIQLHGGIGMTWEYELSHHAKRLIMLSHQFGDEDHHQKAYAALMSDE